MNVIWKLLVVSALIAAIAAVFAMKRNAGGDAITAGNVESGRVAELAEGASREGNDLREQETSLPRLVDVGGGTCVLCKMMMPVLAQLKQEYASTLRVEYYDVNKDPNAVATYRIITIPTQIFFDASGKELFRNSGFLSKQDIVAKWRELGVELTKAR